MANKRFLDFTTDETPSGSSFILEADSVNGVRKTTIEKAVAATDAFANINTKVSNLWGNAAAHNGIYRGKDLTAYFDSGEMSAALQVNDFSNIYPGDYIRKSITIDGVTYSDIKFIIMDLDYYLYTGETSATTVTAHHVVIMPENGLGIVKMNSENTTIGGYLGSAMWTTHIPKMVTGFVNAFGSSHILEHSEYLTNAINNGASSGGEYVRVKVNLPNENMILGSSVTSSSFFDVGEGNIQFAAFRLNHVLSSGVRYWWWLRSIGNNVGFSIIDGTGVPRIHNASQGNYVRPYALLY